MSVPGLYDLNVRVGQIDGTVGFRRDLFQSPWKVVVRGAYDEYDLEFRERSALPMCSSASEATKGRWLRFDVMRYSEAEWADIVASTTRDRYLWVPYTCRLISAKTYSKELVKSLFSDTRVCICGDSYARTLIVGWMAWAQVLDTASPYESSRLSWNHNGIYFWWHNCEEVMEAPELTFDKCLDKSHKTNMRTHDKVFGLEGILVGMRRSRPFPSPSTISSRFKTLQENASGSSYIVGMNGHPWSGDLFAFKRNNIGLENVNVELKLFETKHDADVFDAFGLAFPRIWSGACDGSHVMCWSSGEITVGFWEGVILASVWQTQTQQG